MDPSTASEPPLRPVDEARYVDFTPVGRGGMGIVYWALDTTLNRQVAFKVVHRSGANLGDGITPSAPLGAPGLDASDARSFEGLCRRFRQEAWITGGMEHPGIVPVYELGETDGGVPYYTMRFVRGSRTLHTAIEELAEQGLEQRLHALLEPFLKICDTVRYAHSCGVIHRDLKPENVALGEYGEVVVLDWGLAKVKGRLDPREDPWIDRVGEERRDGDLVTVASAVGTPGFMSPEATRGDSDALDERSDVYALGVVLFQILTGRLPFATRTTNEYMELVLSQPPPDPRAHTPDAPARLAELCLAARALDPEDRPATADAFAEEIRGWRSEAARDREVRSLLQQAATALSLSPGLQGEERVDALDRVTAACARVLELEPENEQAREDLESAHRLHELGVEERERRARRRTLARVGSVALGILLIGAVGAALLLDSRRREAAAARRQAEVDRARAESVMDFMVFDLRESLEPIGRLDVLARLGARAREYYAALPDDGVSAKSLLGHTVTLRRLGEVHEARGDLPAALEAYRLAGAVAERILEQDPDDPIGRYHRSSSHALAGMALFRQGYASDAKRILVEHRQDVVRLRQQHPEDPEYLDALAAADVALGHVLRTEGKWEEADRAYAGAMAVSREIEARHPEEDRWTRRRLHRRLSVAQLLRDRGRMEASVEYAHATLEACRHAMETSRRAADVRWLELEASARYGLAAAHAGAQTWDQALFDGAYEACLRLHVLDPENDRYRFQLAQARRLQSLNHLQAGAQERGLSRATEAFELARDLTSKDPTNASWQNLLITICDQMVRHLLGAGHDAAEGLEYRALAAQHARHLVTLDESNAKWRHVLAYTLSRLGRATMEEDDEEAARLLGRSIEVASALMRDNPTEAELVVLQALSRSDQATLDFRRGRRDAGLDQLRLTIQELTRCWTDGEPRHEVATWLVKAHTLLATELTNGTVAERAEAEGHLREALAFIDRAEARSTGWPAAQVRGLDRLREALRRSLDEGAPK